MNANQIIPIGAAGVSGLLIGSGLGYATARKRSNKKNRRRKSSKNRNRKSKYIYKRKRYPHTAGKRKDRSHRRIRFTKRGQPYIILGNGRARFIKMSSVKNSRKRKGGKY